MFTKLLSTAVVLSASTLVAAQTSTLCDPTKTTCPADNAFGSAPVTVDFTKGVSDVFDIAAGTTLSYDPANGAVFTINKATDAPTITSKKYIFFGKVDIVVQASLGQGVVTSVVLESDDLDEIDWEWLGGDTVEVQTNYFRKGDTTTYDRGGKSPVASPQTGFHTYTIDWTPAAVNWIIDGAVVRTLTYNDAKGGTTFPQSPMQIKIGTWVAGRPDAPQGTIDWAGGLTDFSQAPFNAFYKSITITDYTGSAGDKIVNAATYTYGGDKSGDYGSIQVNLGNGSPSGGSGGSSSAPASTTTKATTSAPATTSAVSTSTTLSTVITSTTITTAQQNSTSSTPTQSSSGINAGVITTSSSSSSPTTSSPTTKAPGNAAGKLALSSGNIAVVGAAMLLGALAL